MLKVGKGDERAELLQVLLEHGTTVKSLHKNGSDSSVSASSSSKKPDDLCESLWKSILPQLTVSAGAGGGCSAADSLA